MNKTVLNRRMIPALAAQIRRDWTRVSRTRHGVIALPEYQQMGSKGYLTKAELKVIGEDKSPRRKALLDENDDAAVEDVTRRAFLANSERARIDLLRSLSGVEVPTASAILSWTFPDRWPVIDQRAWRTLYEANVVTGHANGTGLGSIQWAVYVKAVYALKMELSDKNLTPQHVDRILYQIDDDIRGKRKKGTCRP